MKKFLPIALMATVLTTGSLKANQLTVSNLSTSPGQYTSLQTAINAANAGDTILVSGSGTDYALNTTINISKPVTLYGPG
jgi:hypothetical protein